MLDHIHWLGHASFRINGSEDDEPIIYVDPWRLPPNSQPADLILVTHEHHDHCSPDDIGKIVKEDTLIVGNVRVANLLKTKIDADVHLLRTWQSVSTRGVTVRAVPAYTPNNVYHDRTYGGLGFIVTLLRHDLYFAGDTELIPEMETIGCDIAILPVGGAYTMDVENAVEAVKRIKPLVAIPMHYGREIPGSGDNGRHFVSMVNGGVNALELPIENEHVYI